jgi:ATP-dependent RNA helicase DeaD
MQRYRIEVGHRDGVRPGNIVGAVANEAGIDGGSIGPIKILDSFSTIDLPEGLPRDLYQTLRNTWVVGKQLRISQYNAEGSSEGSEGRGDAKPEKFGKPKFGKSKFGNASGGKPGGFNGKKPGKMKKQKARPE